MQKKNQALNKHRLFSKDKFRQFWNYKNKKLTTAFIINWTIIALIAVIFIIIGSIDMYRINKVLRLYDEYNTTYQQWLGKPIDEWPPGVFLESQNLLSLASKTRKILDFSGSYTILCALVIPLYVITSNLSLFFTKYLLSKKHNKNK